MIKNFYFIPFNLLIILYHLIYIYIYIYARHVDTTENGKKKFKTIKKNEKLDLCPMDHNYEKKSILFWFDQSFYMK